MLTNTEWIAQGKPFPPETEAGRIRRYGENEKLFNGKHLDVFRARYDKIERHLNRRGYDPDTVFNYPQLVTKKTADFVCGEPVLIETGEKETTKSIQAALTDMNFDALLYEAIMDVSRFGDAPVKIMNDRLSIIAPECWFPIVDDTDLKHIKQHVIAFPTRPDEKGNFTEIYVEIHDIGTVEVRRYAADSAGGGMAFGAVKGEPEVINTNLDDVAVKVLKNVSHSKSIFGMDDYTGMRPLVRKLMWRLYCIDCVMDKHSQPTLSGPQSTLTNINGVWRFVPGEYYVNEGGPDSPELKYLTWDGNLESSYQEIDRLLEQLYILTEMGAAFLNGQTDGAATSGTALKLKMVSPRIKAQRIAGVNNQTVKQIVKLAAKVKGIDVDAADISLTWSDGLPDDPTEELNRLLLANGNQPVESQLSTIKRWNELDDEDAQKMLEQIQAEQAAGSPFYTGNINDTKREIPEEIPAADRAAGE